MTGTYVAHKRPDHPAAPPSGTLYEHYEVVYKVLGRRLPAGVEIHHINGRRDDNRNENLVVCENRAYHRLLHRRAIALAACGHADWRCCTRCGDYSPPGEAGDMIPHGYSWQHRACRQAYRRRLRLRRWLRSLQ